MVVTKTRAGSDVIQMPKTLVFERQWGVDRLLTLSQQEMRGWYDHMEKGNDINSMSTYVEYSLADRKMGFSINPSAGKDDYLLLPDGTKKPVRLGVNGSRLLTPPIDKQIAAEVSSIVVNADVHLFDLGKTQRGFLHELIQNHLDLLAEEGIERFGRFRRGIGDSLVHDDSLQTTNHVLVDLNHYYNTTDGKRYPFVYNGVHVNNNTLGPETYLIYHTHPGGVTHPSVGDIQTLKLSGHKSLVIASKTAQDTYTVDEWRPKEGVTADQAVGLLKGLPNVLEERKMVEKLFDRRTLKLQKNPSGKMAITRA